MQELLLGSFRQRQLGRRSWCLRFVRLKVTSEEGQEDSHASMKALFDFSRASRTSRADEYWDIQSAIIVGGRSV